MAGMNLSQLKKMNKKNNYISKFEKILGFIVGYFFSTIVLFFIFSTFNKISESRLYFYIAGIVLSIIAIGFIIELLIINNKDRDIIDTQHFFSGFKAFGYYINLTINSILLTIAYIIGVGITSLFAKLFKKHFLDLKIKKENSTYWTNLDLRKKSLKGRTFELTNAL